MPDKTPWPIVKLGDAVAEITVGYVGPMTAEYRPSGVPFLRSQNVRRLRIDTEGLCYIGPEFHSRLAKSRLRAGDVVVVRTGEPGTAAAIPEWLGEANCADLVVIRPGAVNARYLAYFINSVATGRIAELVVGAVQQHFNVGAARELSLLLPPRAEQDAIAALLGALDDRIESNVRMTSTLSELGSALFRSWFVDFDQVQAKHDRREPIGVSVDLLAMLPEHFVDSQIGPLPQGWEIRPLDTIADFLNGLALQNYPAKDGLDLPVVKIAQLRAGHSIGAERASAMLPPQYVIDDGDVIFSWSGSLMVDVWCGGRGALNQHLFKVTSTEFPKWFVLEWVKEHLSEFQSIAAGKATTMGHIRRHHLSDAKVVVPSAPVLAALSELQEPLLKRVISNRIENRTLDALRDTLLPALLSGELTVKQAEKVVTEVA